MLDTQVGAGVADFITGEEKIPGVESLVMTGGTVGMVSGYMRVTVAGSLALASEELERNYPGVELLICLDVEKNLFPFQEFTLTSVNDHHATNWATPHIGPYITLGHTSTLGHASNKLKCKKFTMHHIGHTSKGFKWKKVTMYKIMWSSMLCGSMFHVVTFLHLSLIGVCMWLNVVTI